MTEPLLRLVEFGRALRAAGLPVGTGRIAQFCRAAALLPPEEVYWAGRATLIGRREDIELYDRVFRAFFSGLPAPRPRPRPGAPAVASVDAPHDVLRRALEGHPSNAALASPVEVLRRKSFARFSPEELAELSRLLAALRVAAPPRRTRRRRPARAGELDLRRTVRRAMRAGGDPIRIAAKERRLRPRRIVFLLDVSGSMQAYSRAMLVLAHAGLHADARWEAFCFGTRLTRVTRALAERDPDAALERAAAEVVDWDGGTRIGASLKRFLDRYGHAGLARGAIVVICSDGLDTGDPLVLAEQMARLGRLARLVVWLNPLKADPAYEPLARGMAAALPHVDVFASGHDLESLEALAETLATAR